MTLGVRIPNLKTVASYRVDKETPVLDAYSFVPLDSSITVESQTELKAYTDECLQLSAEIIKTMVNNGVVDEFKCLVDECLMGEFTLQMTDKSKTCPDDAQHSCMNLLNQLSKLEINESLMSKASRCIQARKKFLHSDKIVGNLLQAKYLKPMLSIVTENCSSSTLKVEEIAEHGFKNIKRWLRNSIPALNIAYSVTTPEAFEGTREKNSLQHVDYRTTKKEKSQPKAHLIIANNMLRKQANIQNALAAIARRLEEGGFVLVNEVTTNFSIIAPIDELYENDPVVVTEDINERTCG